MHIVLTGATRGIGLAAAKRLLADGHDVTLCSEDEADVEQALAALRDAGYSAKGQRCDIAVETDILALIRLAREGGRPIDVWVNNAGIPGITGRTDQLPAAYLQRLIDTNIKGTCLCSVHALRVFHRQGCGRLLNVIGRGAKTPVPFSNSYGPAKMWIRSFTRAVAAELRGTDIRACTFQPGLVRTRMSMDVSVVRGHEHRLKLLPVIQRFLGNEPEFVGASLAAVIIGDMRNGKAYRAPVLGPAIRRLISGAPEATITTRTIEPETDPDLTAAS